MTAAGLQDMLHIDQDLNSCNQRRPRWEHSSQLLTDQIALTPGAPPPRRAWPVQRWADSNRLHKCLTAGLLAGRAVGLKWRPNWEYGSLTNGGEKRRSMLNLRFSPWPLVSGASFRGPPQTVQLGKTHLMSVQVSFQEDPKRTNLVF